MYDSGIWLNIESFYGSPTRDSRAKKTWVCFHMRIEKHIAAKDPIAIFTWWKESN